MSANPASDKQIQGPTRSKYFETSDLESELSDLVDTDEEEEEKGGAKGREEGIESDDELGGHSSGRGEGGTSAKDSETQLESPKAVKKSSKKRKQQGTALQSKKAKLEEALKTPSASTSRRELFIPKRFPTQGDVEFSRITIHPSTLDFLKGKNMLHHGKLQC